MNTIKLQYIDADKRFVAPSEWNELTKKQLFIWSGIILQRIPIELALSTAAIFFYRIPRHLFGLLSSVQRVQLSASLSFLESNDLTRNVIGSFRLFFRRYQGPANRLSNINISEYRRTEIYYQLYQSTRDEMYLNLLCATLFRPKTNRPIDEDPRKPILENDLKKRAETFKWLHPNLRHSILLFYEGCRGYIIKTHPRIFQKSNDNKAKGLFDFEEIVLAISGDKFGTFYQTQFTNLYLFLKHLNDRMEEADRIKRKK